MNQSTNEKAISALKEAIAQIEYLQTKLTPAKRKFTQPTTAEAIKTKTFQTVCNNPAYNEAL